MKRASPTPEEIRQELSQLPSDWRLVRVGRNKAPIAGKAWYDVDDLSPDDALDRRRFPPAFGLKSGPSSGIVILDLDSEGWRESFQEVTGHSIAELPKTISWTSGRPGRSAHAFAVSDPDWWPHLANRRSWRNENSETCWELRGDRCQSVIIGAHPETGRYDWLPGCSPQEVPDPAPAPEWLLEALLIQEDPAAEPVEPSAEDAARAELMLKHLPASEFVSYDKWLQVGMALHHTDPNLLKAWIDWCRGMGDAFDEAECQEKWASFGKSRNGRPVTIRTLHSWAKEHGYREPNCRREHNERSAQARREPQGGSGGSCRDGDPEGAEAPDASAAGRQDDAANSRRPGPRQQDRKRSPKPTPDEVRKALEEAMADGIGGADLELLIQKLADQSDLHPLSVARIAEAVQKGIDATEGIAAEAQTLKVEADRQEIGEALTLHYLLPEPIAEAIDARTRYMPVSGPSAALMFLAGIAPAALLGTQVVGSSASAYMVPTNLYACAVARSGAQKSPAGKALIREPLEPLQRKLQLAYHRSMEKWREQCRGTPRGEENPPEPQPAHLIANDPTGEALVATLQENENQRVGLLLHRDELAGLFGGLNQYRGGRGNDRELLLELFDGGGLSQLRVVGGGRFFSRSQFSIYGTTQPEVLRELVAAGDPSGLWARFLFAPLPAIAVRLPDDDDDTATQAAIDTLRRVFEAIHKLTPRPYRLDGAGAARFRDYHYSRQQAALAATLPAHGALYGKAAGKVLRVAGLLHLAAIGAGTAPETETIPDATVERAVMLVDHLDAYALGIHTDVAGGGPSGILRTVHRVADAAGKPLSVGEVRQKLSKAQRREADALTITTAMQTLVSAGYGEMVVGGKGAIRYRATGKLP